MSRKNREVSVMDKRIVAALAALTLIPLAACGKAGSGATVDDVTYQVDQSVTALVVDARAGKVVVEAGDGPVSVTESRRYRKDKPSTAHAVEGKTLRLTETGCADDNVLCWVEYRIRLPRQLTADITTQAGEVQVTGLTGNVHVTTQAGSVTGKALSGGEAVVQTEAGEVLLEFAKAPTLVRATTQLGEVQVRVPGDTAYAVKVTTDVGTAKVGVDKDPASAHRIEVQTDVGSVEIEPLP
jgi:DUF4097 and DUF4098 domain-containing protein YvlB